MTVVSSCVRVVYEVRSQISYFYFRLEKLLVFRDHATINDGADFKKVFNYFKTTFTLYFRQSIGAYFFTDFDRTVYALREMFKRNVCDPQHCSIR